MPVDTSTYRATIGAFTQPKPKNTKPGKKNKFRNLNFKAWLSSIKATQLLLFFNLIISLLKNPLAKSRPVNKDSHALHPYIQYCTILLIAINLLALCGDIHPNPGPQKILHDSLSVYFLHAQSIKASKKKHPK